MYSLILHGRRSLELHKWRNLRVSMQSAFSLSNSFSSSASARDGGKEQIFTFSYLVDSLGFSATLAESISRKVSFKNKANPDAVMRLLRSYGFTDSQISSIVTKYPRLLLLDAEKCVGPKLQLLQSMKGGSSSDQLIETVTKVPKLLAIKGDKTISRYYDVVKEIGKAGKSSKFEKLCHSLPQGLQENKIRNVSVLREMGVPQRLLLPLLVSDRKLVCGDGKFKESLKKVVEMGFDPTSLQFVQALGVIQGLSDKAIKEQVDVYKQFGFSERDVWEIFKKCPTSLRLPEWRITLRFHSLRICGLQDEEIRSVIKKFPRCIGFSERKTANSFDTIVGLGFGKDDFAMMVKGFPRCLNISSETVKNKTKLLVKKKHKFMVGKMKWSQKAMVSYPEVLGYSMEKRIVPRCNVMKALMSKGLLGSRESKLPEKESVLLCSSDDFLDRFVRNHENKELVAELMAIFSPEINCAS